MKQPARSGRARNSRSMRQKSRIANAFSQVASSLFPVRKPVGKHGFPAFYDTLPLSTSSKSQGKQHTRKNRRVSYGVYASVQSQGVQGQTGVVSVQIDNALREKLEEVAPLTRKAIRQAQKAAQRKTWFVTSASLAALVSSAAATFAFAHTEDTSQLTLSQSDTTQVLPAPLAAASRSFDRTPLEKIQSVSKDNSTQNDNWTLDGDTSNVDATKITGVVSTHPEFLSAVSGGSSTPNTSHLTHYVPNHPTGDVGNAYEFSQCTWWVYVRRHQLGLPVGSHMGNGHQWANSARALGYWVDNTVRQVGDILVFAPGQYKSDPLYGHVAVVEKINPDGSVVTSECGEVTHGRTYSRVFTASQIKTLQVIHY